MPELIYALGFSWRKRSLLRRFLAGCDVRFVSRADQVPVGASVAVWASGPFGRELADGAPPDRFGRLYVEDGFLRSVGLGADLVSPLSWVFDRSGIYYDATRPSDLEVILQAGSFDVDTLQRARALRRMMVSSGVTKYNLGTHIWHPPAQAAGRQLVLVTGQVESDASLRLGAPGISTNIALLKAAREMHPLAWLLYKPHPDVVAGLRGEGFMESSASQWCDEVVTDVAMGQLLKTVEVVHVMTSLSGFEALIRGKRVVCHGSPFYSGWGLTSDLLETPRRSRSLNLDQLVAGALLEYPRYLNRRTGQPGSAEDVLADMLEWKANAPLHLPWWRRAIRPILRRP